MLFLTVTWAALAALFYLVGTGLLNLLSRGGTALARPGDRFLVASWLGVAALANLLVLVSLVSPVSTAVGGAVAAAAAALALASARVRAETAALLGRIRAASAGILALLLGAAVLGSKQVTWYDTGLYHYGAIRWLGEHGAVKGLALLHSRFGVASSWFALSAPFDEGPLEARAGTVLGGFAVLLFATHFLLAARRIVQGSGSVADAFFALAFVLLFPLVIWMGASASPDLPVLILTAVIGWLLLVVGASPAAGGADAAHRLPFLLACGAATFKLSALPLVGVAALFALYRAPRRGRELLLLPMIGAACITPLLMLNAVLSGCLLYPASLFCLDVPWGIGPEAAVRESRTIREWARWDAPTPAGAGDWNWMASWVARTPLHLAATGLLAASALLTAGLAARGARPGPSRAGELAVLALFLLGSGFTLASAPAPRFLLAYAGLPLALAGALAWRRLRAGAPGSDPSGRERPWLRWLAPACGAAIALGALALNLRSETIGGRVAPDQLLLPHRMERPHLLLRQSNDITYWQPVDGDDRCWAAELPCTPYALSRQVRFAHPDRGLRGGLVRSRPER